MTGLPMPGNRVAGCTVIASCYVTDELALVVLLESQPPFYTVAEYRIGQDPPAELVVHGRERNIHDACELYADCGGGR